MLIFPENTIYKDRVVEFGAGFRRYVEFLASPWPESRHDLADRLTFSGREELQTY